MIQLRIGIDIDGCVFPWTRSANEALMSKFGIEDPGEHQHWDYLENEVGGKKFSWLWTSEAAEMIFGRLDLIYRNAADVVNTLARSHDVHFVTHRNPFRTSEVTGKWLNYHFRDYVGVHVLNNRCKKWELGTFDVFIDDKISTVDGFRVCTDVPTLLVPERPWSEDPVLRAEPRVHYFADWVEVEGLIRAAVPA